MITQEDIMTNDSDNPVIEQEHDGMANNGSSKPFYYEMET
jgi:hypothetical protein